MSVAPPSVVFTSWLPAVTVRMHSVALAQSIELKVLPAAIFCASHISPPLVERSSVFGPIAYASLASTKCTAVTFEPAGSAIGVHDTPPSGVVYAELSPEPGSFTKAMPTLDVRKCSATPTPLPPPLEEGVPGSAVLRVNVSPPSVVASSVPLASSRKPTCGETKLNDATGSGQLDSATLKIRVNVCPPLLEMRVMQPPPPPTTTVEGESTCNVSMLPVVPVVRPLHDDPALLVESTVPPLPTA